jgi:hypothetical protein
MKAKTAKILVARKYFGLPNRQNKRPASMQQNTHENSVINIDTYQRKFVGARKRTRSEERASIRTIMNRSIGEDKYCNEVIRML